MIWERERKRERRKETEVERKRVAVWNNKARKQRKEEAIGLLAVQVQILSFFISQKKKSIDILQKKQPWLHKRVRCAYYNNTSVFTGQYELRLMSKWFQVMHFEMMGKATNKKKSTILFFLLFIIQVQYWWLFLNFKLLLWH